MLYKGIISSVNESTARVYIKEIDFLTSEIPWSNTIEQILPNDNVLVAFTGKSLVDGMIIDNLTRGTTLSGDKTYTHNQIIPSSTWNIEHNLSKYPAVTVTDSAGSVVIGDMQYISENKIVINFVGDFSGKAYLN